MEFCAGWICCLFVCSDHRHCMVPSRVCGHSWRCRRWSWKCFFQMHWWCSWHPWIVCSELTYWLNHKSMHKPQIYSVRGPLCSAKSEGCIGVAEQIFCQGLLRVYQKCFWHPWIVCSELTYWLKHKSMHKPQIYSVRGPLCNAKSEGCIGVAEQIFCQG